jgi:hypothetical protein
LHHLNGLQAHFRETGDEVMVVVSSIGTHRLRAAYRTSVQQAIRQSSWAVDPPVMFAPAEADPALQVADYMLWATMRWWDRGDSRALAPVRSKVRSQVDLFARGAVHYY